MKRNRLVVLMSLLLLCLVTTSCRKYSGFKHDSSGFYYHFHQVNEQNPKPATGDFVVVNMALRTDKDVITPMTLNNMLVDELYRGDIYCALRSMHLDDSATFIFDGRKFYEEFLGMGEYPYGKTPIYADVKLLKIMPKQNLERAEEMYNEQMKLIRQREDSLVWDYVDRHFLDSVYQGIHFTYNLKGNGPKPVKDQTVQVLFVGRRLDNSVFVSRDDSSNPLTFEIGKGQVAAGWDVLLPYMCVGDRITMVVNSSYAFGEKGSEEYQIPPYTPVVYELELQKIVK
jgi:FKBP-type peptidyl-prolyl cis-trans isomerase